MADRFGLTLLILYPFLLSVSTEGRNFLNFDHRGSSSPGHGEELTACGRPPFPLSVSTDWGNFLNIDKFTHKHYNIYRYNTKGKRRSAHHPKGGVKYDRTDYDVACCA